MVLTRSFDAAWNAARVVAEVGAAASLPEALPA
jgi:hypothetical protein